MIIENFPQANLDKIFDVCILGSGAASITLAMDLEKAGLDIIILESGGINRPNIDDQSEKIIETGYATEVNDRRLKFFGGTTGHWGGWCSPLDESDFNSSSDLFYPGWPLKLKELEPYYSRAIPILNLEHCFFNEPKAFAVENEANKLGLCFKYYQFSRPVTRFGTKYKEQIERSQNIKVFLNSPAVAMNLTTNGHTVESVSVKSNNLLKKIKARHFVMCCGSIENARLLMSFGRKNNAAIGLGSHFLGKYFFEHAKIDNVGAMFLSKKSPWGDLLDSEDEQQIKKNHFFFQIHPDIRKKNNWLNLRFKIVPYEYQADTLDTKLHKFYNSILKSSIYPLQKIVLSCEHEPQASNGIVLLDKTDNHGLYNIKINWELSERDWKSYTESMNYFSKKLPRLNMGNLRLRKLFMDRKEIPRGNSHQMGMTRMGDTSRDGYVDKNLSVFGVSNLSVLGSSVFPTGGVAPPTLTIVALALRLSEYLRKKLIP